MAKKKKEHTEKVTFEFRTVSTDKLIGFETTVLTSPEPLTEHEMAIFLIKHEQKLLEEEIVCKITDGDDSDRILKEMADNDSDKLKEKIKELKEAASDYLSRMGGDEDHPAVKRLEKALNL